VSRYHERKHRRGAGRRRPSSVPAPETTEPDPDPPPTPDPTEDFQPGWPFPPATTAWNMAMSASGRVGAFRIACPKAGTLEKIWLHLKCGSSTTSVGGGYGAGTTGTMLAGIFSCDSQGKPADTLYQDVAFTPGWYSAAAGTLDRDNENSVYVDANSLVVTEDQLIIVLWKNTHASPGSNYFSINALHDDTGPRDAFAANNLSIDYENATNGFDPRTNTLWSTNGGASWTVPGGPFGGAFQPAYGLEYSDGTVYGQPFYYGASLTTSEVQVLKGAGTHTYTYLASVSVNGGSTSNIVIKKNDVTHQTITTHAATAGSVVRTAITPLSVSGADVVKIEYNGSGRGMMAGETSGVWDDVIFDLTTSRSVYRQANVDQCVPIYLEPIPAAWKLTAASG
jgi:hypothetical protein